MKAVGAELERRRCNKLHDLKTGRYKRNAGITSPEIPVFLSPHVKTSEDNYLGGVSRAISTLLSSRGPELGLAADSSSFARRSALVSLDHRNA
jgi:hypothetical protein